MKPTPRNHLSIPAAARRLGHSPRWVKELIKRGRLEGFRWASNDLTVSEESIVALEALHRVSPPAAGPAQSPAKSAG